MQATTTKLTAQDVYTIVQTIGADQVGEAEFDNLCSRLTVGTLSPEKVDALAAILVEHAPMHVAAVETRHVPVDLYADAALDRMRQLTGQETSR